MFNITGIEAGWLKLTLYKGFKKREFWVSYLTDFIKEMRYLLGVTIGDEDARRIMLDGEGQELYITAWRDQYTDKLYLIWEHYNKKGKRKCELFEFNATKLINHFNRIFNNVSEDYYSHFDWETYAEMMDEEI